MPWSDDIPVEWDYVEIPTYPDGAGIDVKFKCGKCGRKLLAEAVEIPPYALGDTVEPRNWGDSALVECKCGETYDIVADNSIAGWDVNFENENPPKSFRYKEVEVHI